MTRLSVNLNKIALLRNQRDIGEPEITKAAKTAIKAGASLRSSLGALIGAITGAILGTFIIPVPLFGTLIGSGIGACAFELSRPRKPKQTFHLGLGAGFGQILGASIKIILGGLIWLIVAIAAFWP